MRLISTVALTIVLFSFVVALPASAGDRVIPRINISAEKVAKDSSWTDMAKQIGLPFTDLFRNKNGEATGTVAVLPTPCVGRMYGGAWGMSGSEHKMMIGGYELWKQSECPGVLGKTPNGVIVHAQLGGNGTRFLFVGVRAGSGTDVKAAQTLKQQLERALANQDSADWQTFDKAVANTTTGRMTVALYNKLNLEYNPDQDKAVKAGSIEKQEKQAAGKTAGNPSDTDKGVKSTGSIAGDLWRFAKSLWWLWLIALLVILAIVFRGSIADWWDENIAWRFEADEEPTEAPMPPPAQTGAAVPAAAPAPEDLGDVDIELDGGDTPEGGDPPPPAAVPGGDDTPPPPGDTEA